MESICITGKLMKVIFGFLDGTHQGDDRCVEGGQSADWTEG